MVYNFIFTVQNFYFDQNLTFIYFLNLELKYIIFRTEISILYSTKNEKTTKSAKFQPKLLTLPDNLMVFILYKGLFGSEVFFLLFSEYYGFLCYKYNYTEKQETTKYFTLQR
ncbi:hypothetical protein ACJX0J_032607, partial [Zea mays]